MIGAQAGFHGRRLFSAALVGVCLAVIAAANLLRVWRLATGRNA